MDKIDYRKVYREAYQAKPKPALLAVPPMQFLMLDGQGDPEHSPAFAQAIEALYTLAYTLKFRIKKGPSQLDFAVMPLEGLWWADDMDHFEQNRELWRWTLMIMQPPVVDGAQVEEARAEALRKKPSEALAAVRLEAFDEGRAIQVLHTGPFSEERPTIERLHRHGADQGLALRGRHHEIYLSDMRRTDPARLKTILRQPVE